MDTDALNLAALASSESIGAKRLTLLLEQCGSGQGIWKTSTNTLARVVGQKIASEIDRIRTTVDLGELESKLTRDQVSLILYGSALYPAVLAELPDAPALLFARGNVELLDSIMIAVVGARRATSYGLTLADEFGTGLAAHGVTVVSGLAIGIDGAVHHSVLEAGGGTIGVIGCGIDTIYPQSHQRLFAELIASGRGLILSEYPPGLLPLKQHFPARNRIIAGLSRAVVVLEAAEDSGALITARLALDYNREVFAVPHDITRSTGQGGNALLAAGAHIARNVPEVLTELQLLSAGSTQRVKQLVPADESEAQIMKALLQGELSLDELVQSTGLSTQAVSATLTLMELTAKVRTRGQGNYELTGSYQPM